MTTRLRGWTASLQLSQVAGIDPLSRDGLVRWSAEVVDVYSNGVFAAAADDGGA